jgi:hypothetical protein
MVMASGEGQPSPRTAWWADDTELIAFARVLVEAGQLGDPHRVIDFFREPQRWTPAYEVWRELGRPEHHADFHFHEMTMRFFAQRNSLRARGA